MKFAHRPYCVMLALVFCGVSLQAQEKESIKPETKILFQTGSPVSITAYRAVYLEGSRFTDRGIHHILEFENNSDRKIVAIQFGLVAFDIWNEFLDRTGGVTMETLPPGAKDKGEWVASRYADFSFHTGVAYVSKVRFEDGQIWNADLPAIAVEMRKIEKTFDIKQLQKKDESPKP